MTTLSSNRRRQKPSWSSPNSPIDVSIDSSMQAIGIGIDTARYGHPVTFLGEDKQPAFSPLLIMELVSDLQQEQ